MKLYYYEATRELTTSGYVIAGDEKSARADAVELSDVTDSSIWDSDWGVEVFLSEAQVTALKDHDFIWHEGDDINVAKALKLLEVKYPVEYPPEIPGQEAFNV